MEHFLKFGRMAILLLIACFFSGQSDLFAQSSGVVQSPTINAHGFFLKKTAPAQVVAGVTFDYQIFVTIPAGATGVVLTDLLPAGVQYVGYAVSASLNVPPPVLGPPPVPGTTPFQLTWASVPAGANGTVTITVKFPNGTSCPQMSVRNSACLSGKAPNGQSLPQGFCTEFVNTAPIAVDPWNIYKQPVGTYLQPTTGGQCPNVSPTRTIRYRITVWKNPGTTGQMSLFNAKVEDAIPNGTGFNIISIPAGTSATYTGGATGKVIWTLNNVLDATPFTNSQMFEFEITYPSSATSPISNVATLFGDLAKATPSPSPCGTVTRNSNSTCVAIGNPPPPVGNLVFSKNATLGSNIPATGGVQPGCTFYYWLWICNNGTGPLTGGYSISDNLPAGVTIAGAGDVSVNDQNFTNGVPAGFTVTATTTSFTVSTTNALPASSCHFVYIRCTLSPSATVGSTVTNCATLTAPFLTAPVQRCASFTVQQVPPTPCISKMECSAAPRPVGSTFRYRIAVRNVGGQDISGASIQDVLHPSLQYLSSPAPLYYTTANGSLPACASGSTLPAGSTAWTPSPTGPTVSGQTVTWNGVQLPKTCNAAPGFSCGSGAFNGEPMYFIEFSVKVRDTSAIGHVPNFVRISGGGIAAPVTSNTWITHITGSPGFALRKNFRLPNGDTTGTITLMPTGTGRFNLNFLNGAVALRGLTFVDLLPVDNSPSGDFKILSRTTVRTPATAFDLNYTGGDTYSPTAQEGWETTMGLENANVNPLSGAVPSLGTVNLFPYNVGPATVWTPPAGSIPNNTENFYYYYGTGAIAANGAANAQFNFQVPAGVPAQRRACNSFAANGYHLQVSPVNPLAASNATNYGRVALTPAESNNACVTSIPAPDTCCPKGVLRPQERKCCSKIDLFGLPNCTSPIKSVGLGGISGGLITSITASGAGSGTGSSSINFSTPVVPTTTTPLTLEVCGASTAPDGLVSYVVNAVLANANSTRCTYRDTLYCDPCDTICKTKLNVKRCVCNGSALDYLTLNVLNMTTPNLPICAIKVTASSVVWTFGAPFASPVAGTVSVSGTMATFTPTTPSTFVNGASAQFQLFYPHSSTFPGSISVFIDYCGKACDTTIVWKPNDVPPNGSDALVRLQSVAPLYPTLYQAAYRLEKSMDPPGSRPVKYIGVSVPTDSKSEIIAVTGAALTQAEKGDRAAAYLQLAASSHGLKNAMFELPTAMSADNLDQGVLHLIFGREKPAILEIALYAEDGSLIYNKRQPALKGTDIVAVERSFGVSEYLEGSPNPARDVYRVQYEADGSHRYTLQMFNLAGQLLRSEGQGVPDAGLQSVDLLVSDLPEGTYFVRLETEEGQVGKMLKFVVIR